MNITVRDTDFQTLTDTLAEQQARKVDVLVEPDDVRATEGGLLEIRNHEPQLSDWGFAKVNGLYRPDDVALGHLAQAFKVDTRNLRRWLAERPDVWAAVVNGLWKGQVDPNGYAEPFAEPDARTFFLRAFTGEGGEPGTFRALLSDRYGVIDHLDVLTATLKGIEAAANELGHPVTDLVSVTGADVSERRMFVRFASPVIAVAAGGLLANYRNPFRDNGGRGPSEVRVGGNGWDLDRARRAAALEGLGYPPGQEPVVWAGFEIGNSEVGAGSAYVAPRAVVEICGNGLRLDVEMFKARHSGVKRDRDNFRWSQDTQRKRLEVIAAETRDSVREFLDPEFWAEEVRKLERLAGKEVADPRPVLEAKELGFSETERESIFRHFMLGGSPTAGGVMNAVTSYAQTVADPDRANELETLAVKVLRTV
jgi:hypothetical protein